MNKYLLFIDTNILLDYYRVRNESGLALLRELDGLHDKLITTYQVEMEFKKNRQAAILESLKSLKKRDLVAHPAFLADTKSADVLNKKIGDANKRIGRFRDRLTQVLRNPTTHDPVYKIAQRLFVSDTAVSLTRSMKERHQVKRLAFRRFLLGYPPRKAGDTSIGDALNWEWMAQVAQARGVDIAIVSRDTDYGVDVDTATYVNDWLLQEFRDRVSKKRHVRLFNRLAPALRLIDVKVTKETDEEEARFVVDIERPANVWPEVGEKGWVKRFERLLLEAGPSLGPKVPSEPES